MTAIATKEPATIPASTKRSQLLKAAERWGMEPAAFEATVRATCGCAGATREEFAAFLLVANEYGLNPITREIYAFPKKGGGIQPIVGIDGWMKMANASDKFDGLTVEFAHDENGKLVSATATVYRKDRTHPVVVTEYLVECQRGTDPWKMAHRMLRHKAAIQAIRYAFGFAGVMEPDEAEAIIDRDARPAAIEREPAPLPPLSEEEFAKQLPAWRSAIEAGKKTADQIIHMAGTRWTLHADQVESIALLTPGRVAADGEIIDADFEQGDAYEEPVAVEGGAA
jgi:phage recombination protein Bet